MISRTVDCDSDTLVEGVAISANKGWDLSELVDLEVFGGDALSRLGLNNRKFDVVCFCYCLNGSRARVALK